jgi:lipid A 3-O-deacylase
MNLIRPTFPSRSWKTTAKILAVAFLVPFAFSSAAIAQARPEEGGRELQVWTSGGHSIFGGIGGTSVWTAGVRYGWVLTKPHGPGVLRGRFEFAVDAVPAFIVFQPANTAYGASFDPVVLKWNFESDRRVVPYVEIAGGVLFTTQTVPTGTSRANFTPQAALGLHILHRRLNWSVEVRYEHISNAGLTSPNPGLNTIQGRVGIGIFTRGHHTDHRP